MRVAEVVPREGVEDDACGIGLIVQSRGRRCEHAFTSAAAPQLNGFKFFLPRSFLCQVAAVAVRTTVGTFAGVLGGF